MATITKAQLKALWVTGYKPTQTDYANLFDAIFLYRPTTEPAISTGTLTLDCDSSNECLFEPRLSVGTLTINTDFTLALSNSASTALISFVLSLTGTRIITLPADFMVSIPSSIGTWDSVLNTLTLVAGTDDIIEFQILKYNTSSKWLLKVSEVAI